MRIQIFEANQTTDIRFAIKYNEIGIVWVMNNEYEKAVAAFESSIQIYQNLDDH